MTLLPEDDYRDYPEYANLPRQKLRRLIFFQGLEAPEVYLGSSPYEGEEAEWWDQGKQFWYEMEEGARIDEHPYFKEK